MRALLLPIAAVALALSTGSRRDELAGGGDRRLREASGAFLTALRPESRARAAFAFEDAARLDWHFVPRERRGLPLGDMNDEERRAAHALLRAVLSSQGYRKALGVIELEGVLREAELAAGRDGAWRDPGRYFFSVFGSTAPGAPCMVRFEGHHLSLQFTAMGEEGFAPTPAFFGANPAEVRHGPRAGMKLLAAQEELARELVRSLSPEQRAQAVISAQAPPDVLFGPGQAVAPGDAGLAGSAMSGPQRALLLALVNEAAGDVSPPFGSRAPRDALAPDSIRFAWAGGVEPGQGHYYRIAAPRFVFEYDNTQDGANHVHTLWRDPVDDFAAGWLARHLEREHRQAK